MNPRQRSTAADLLSKFFMFFSFHRELVGPRGWIENTTDEGKDAGCVTFFSSPPRFLL
jgi:hypothetical protein